MVNLMLSLLLFGSWFEEGALRVDLYHGGTAHEETYRLRGFYRLPHWAGNPEKLIDTTGGGCYQVRLHDFQTGELLYSRGYCTLFGEWQTTEEAKKLPRGFHESLRIPFPKKKVQLIILGRDQQNAFTEIFSLVIDPKDPNIIPLTSPDTIKTRKIHEGGPIEQALDILILCEGYTQKEEEKCWDDGSYFGNLLLHTPPFDAYAQHISITVLWFPSIKQGPTEPLKGYYTHSPAGCSFNTFGAPRYLTTTENRAIQDLTASIPWDSLFIMVNSSRYGGGGIYNQFSIFTTDNEYSDYVFIHEFGHGFAGLADEYFTPGVSEDFYPLDREPWEPNITSHLEPLKWQGLVSQGTPIPTPAEKTYLDRVGAFEGAGYREKGLWRPSLDCIMHSKGEVPFCPVCSQAIQKHIELYLP